MRFGSILALVQCSSNQGWKDELLPTFSELSFESGFSYPVERLAWIPIFMTFGAILALVQGGSNQDWKYALLSTFSEFSFESGFTYPFVR